MKWIAAVVAVALLAGSGVFFALQGLDRSDKFASVGGFLLALAVAIVSVFLHFRGRDRAGEQSSAHVRNHIHDNDVVITDPVGHISFTIDRRKRHWLS
ncbi:hypothetical protein [Winogradskya humida]|uniref:Uncharacterized protein n=1 Tax=Winogradskya humida TaxID=113566 RepID=A0ABQ3ZHR5_9ACTN|nr:hypothetical protein [Actinoplanes humidus]GIE18125.1 hypothetical protein Ahu01nite_012270 [Actinoplanes humidus]